MKKIKIITTLIFLCFSAMGFAQDKMPRFFYEVSLNKGFGFEDMSVNYRRLTIPTSEKIYFSLGAGGGLEARIGMRLFKNMAISAGGNFQIIFNNKSERIGGFKNRSRASLFRKSLSTSLSYRLPISHERTILQAIKFSAGYDYYLPSTLKREVDRIKKDKIHYEGTQGFHIETLFLLPLSSKLTLNLGGKYHYAVFETKDELMPADAVFQEVNGQGFDFKIGISGSF